MRVVAVRRHGPHALGRWKAVSQFLVTVTVCRHAPQGLTSTAEASRPASELCAGRGHWLYFTWPEKPAAGGHAVIYFNKACSEPLRCCGVSAETVFCSHKCDREPWHCLVVVR